MDYIYVARRPFKSNGVFYEAGSIIKEPAEVKRLRGKLADRKIVRVTKDNYSAFASFMQDKRNVSIEEALKKALYPEVEVDVVSEVVPEVEIAPEVVPEVEVVPEKPKVAKRIRL